VETGRLCITFSIKFKTVIMAFTSSNFKKKIKLITR
jgi:hypothetical protein